MTVQPILPPDDADNDDLPIGRLLTRREMLTVLGGATAAAVTLGAGAAALAQTATPTATATRVPTCVVSPALTEGPYFVDDQLERVDIRIDPTDNSVKPGMPIKLTFHVSDVSGGVCAPLAGVQVDLWHCDALGMYSGVSDRTFNTVGEKWLRGYQITDEAGEATFITIYPGWYSGRTTHMHFKIRTDPDADSGYEFTSQLFFDEALTDVIHAAAPYAAKGYRDTFNNTDSIFQGSEGLLTLSLEEGDVDGEAGYVAVFDIGLDLSQPAPTASMGGGQPGGMPPGGARPGGRP
jgi:protocatechuate 3,4-dioxygenase beta subunit